LLELKTWDFIELNQNRGSNIKRRPESFGVEWSLIKIDVNIEFVTGSNYCCNSIVVNLKMREGKIIGNTLRKLMRNMLV
jgi:hypothetical protein